MSHQEMLVEQAEELLSYDPPFALIPVKLSVNEEGRLEKKPVVPWKQDGVDEKTLFKKLRARAGANALAFDLERSGLLVIDIDAYKPDCNWGEWLPGRAVQGHEFPETWEVSTGSGGVHLIFANPDGHVFPGHLPGVSAVDVKMRGIEIIPPSAVGDRGYRWVIGPEDLEDGPAPIPDWFVEEFARGSRQEVDGAAALRLGIREPEENIDLLNRLPEAPNKGVSYDEWVQIGMGMHFEFHDTEFEPAARGAFIEWTLNREEGTSDRDLEKAGEIWDAFPRGADIPSPPITVATVHKFLREVEGPVEVELPPKPERQEVEGLHPVVFDGTLPPPRPWLYGVELLAGELSALFAPGGAAKTSLNTSIAVALASGQRLLHDDVPKPRKVMLWSGEEDQVEMERRLLATMKHFGISADDVSGRLYVQTSDTRPLNIAFEAAPVVDRHTGEKAKLKVNEEDVSALVRDMQREEIDVLIVDPYVATHQLNENDATHVNLINGAFRDIARRTGAAVCLTHHVHKSALREGDKGDPADAARGSTSFVNSVRIARALRVMSLNDAQSYKVENLNDYVEVIDAKANYAAKVERRWLRKVSVDLGNGTPEYPKGDQIGVVVPWVPTPDMELDRMERIMLAMQTLREQLDRYDDDGEGFVFVREQNSYWAGVELARVLGWPIGEQTAEHNRSDEENRNRVAIKALLSDLVENFGVTKRHSRKKPDGKPAPVYTPEEDRIADLESTLKILRADAAVSQ